MKHTKTLQLPGVNRFDLASVFHGRTGTRKFYSQSHKEVKSLIITGFEERVVSPA